MVTKKLIESELDNLTEEQLNQVYSVIQQLHDSQNSAEKISLMSQLQQIEIDAPEHFSLKVARDLGRGIGEDFS